MGRFRVILLMSLQICRYFYKIMPKSIGFW